MFSSPHPVDRTSYGVLLAEAGDATTVALSATTEALCGPREAADAIIDLERYLAVGGRHLQLIAAPITGGRRSISFAHRNFARRLAELHMEHRGDNPWSDAGDRLGLAHDVLATHIGPIGHYRTPEGEVLADDVQRDAFARVSALLDEPLSTAQGMLARARNIQPSHDQYLTRSMAAHLRQRVASIQAARAAAEPLPSPAVDKLAALDALRPALTNVPGVERPNSAMAALRVLRQLSYRQSDGTEPANAHTLSELCELGRAACRTGREHLPVALTPMDRVDRASALDRLMAAESVWTAVSHHLLPRVRGLSKAAGVYHEAMIAVTREASANAGTTAAVFAALPRLATDAASTVRVLGMRRDLVAWSRRPGELGGHWAPLVAGDIRTLSDGFLEAAGATRTALNAYERLTAVQKQRRPERLTQPRTRLVSAGAPR